MLGIRTIGRMFRIMDDSGDHKLNRVELTTGLHDYGLSFTPSEFEALWNFLDRDRSGTIDYDEFLRGVRGDMNDRRVEMVALAFDVLDKTDDGKVWGGGGCV
jgi:Ca2+-binding EF-hand superfamily protein